MRPLIATVNLAAIRNNYLLAKSKAQCPQAFAVVKANAYGHGVREVVTVLGDVADGFAVACLEEAAEVRGMHSTARILLLEGCFEPVEVVQSAALGLDIVVQGEEQVRWLLDTPLERPINVWMALDSGMHRLGFDLEGIRQWFAVLRNCPWVKELNLLSHFSTADESAHPKTQQQADVFVALSGVAFDQRSLANSAAVLTLGDTHHDWVRPGIILYGASPFAERNAHELGLQAAMTLTAQVISLRTIPAGETVGYGAIWKAERETRIATICCGYADGYPRTAPAGTPVVVNGQRAPLVGRVSMDMLTVDVTDVADVTVGSSVELWGEHVTVDEVAQACGTLGYELLTRVTARVHRQYSH